MKKTASLFFLLLLIWTIFPALPVSGAVFKGTDLPVTLSPTHRFQRLFKVFSVTEPLHLVLVEKKQQRLLVLRHDGTLKLIASFVCATGENPGRKRVSGDSRTPEGIYFITKIFKDNKITIFGNRALHLDYPNIFDKLAGNNGDGIYLHGTNKKLKPNSTNGCITLANDDLKELVQYMDMMVTPVVVVDDLESLDSLLATRGIDSARLEKSLLPASFDPRRTRFDSLYLINYGGRQAVAVGEFSQRRNDATRRRGYGRSYLQFRDGKDWQIMERITNTTPIQIYPLYPMKIAASPLSQLSRDRVAKASIPAPDKGSAPPVPGPPAKQVEPPSSRLTLLTPLSLKQPPEPSPLPKPKTAAEIVRQPLAEPSSSPPAEPGPATATVVAKKAAPHPPVPAVKEAQPAHPRDRREIMAFIEAWRTAWSNKDLDAYIAAYHPGFRQDGMNLAAWRAHKARLNRTYKFIKVTIKDIRIKWTGSGAIVSFRQGYRSDRYVADGTKTLHLDHTGPGWLIKRELWSKAKRTDR
ncbi:MAG: L,D-transpeptidase family protein [Desulfobacterales bacterium]|nr:L,D-transpeptidase family protein [Desulfobacterales bacterium]